MSEPDPATAPHALRRRFLIDKRFQFYYVKICGWVCFVGLAVAFLFYVAVRYSLGTNAIDPLSLRIMGGMSLLIVVFCAFMAALTIQLTHRVAGAAFNLDRSIDRLKRGDFGTTIRLREADYLQNVATSLNSLQDALKARREEALKLKETLERMKGKLPADEGAAADHALQTLDAMTRVEPPAPDQPPEA